MFSELQRTPRVAEFFAGIGLVRMALEAEGCRVDWANDHDPLKARLYALNFSADELVVSDIARLDGRAVPDVELATASFPCTDLSLAGARAGLNGRESSVFWEFARLLREMGDRRPKVVLLENVVGLATSHGGKDIELAITELNKLGYVCDAFVVDARLFVPQSRPRLFIVGTPTELPYFASDPDPIRPPVVARIHRAYPHLRLNRVALQLPKYEPNDLSSIVERLSSADDRWWSGDRLARFVNSLSPVNQARLTRIRAGGLTWRTAYRRTRHHSAVWEIRRDSVSGCLRTARGGSSKQAVVEAGEGKMRVRWMTPREYARLQGAPTFRLDGASDSQSIFGFGDAVCVPVVRWVARNYLLPVLRGAVPEGPQQLGLVLEEAIA